jgi:hypothetical protein
MAWIPFWFPAPERERWRSLDCRRERPFPVASAEFRQVMRAQAAATGEQIARAAAQMKLTFMGLV